MAVLPVTPIQNVIAGNNAANTLTGTNQGDLIIGAGGNDTISGQGAGDAIWGNKGADIINGGQGPDTIVWTNGDGSDTVNGGQGNDTQVVEGNPFAGETFTLSTDGSGAAQFARTSQVAFQINLQNVETLDLQSLGGNDRFTVQDLSGTSINQIHFRGGDGNDVLRSQGSTPIRAEGENGNDDLRGGSGSDQIHGGAGNDTLWGQLGNDWLQGDAGADRLNGGAGRDVLVGGAGDDNLTGGAGGDFFFVHQAEGNDTIADFQPGSDVVVLQNLVNPNGGALNNFSQIQNAITEDNGDTVIDLSDFNNQGASATVTISNVTGLTAQDFVFI